MSDKILKITLLIVLNITLLGCYDKKKISIYSGKAQGTTFNIKIYGQNSPNLSIELDSILLLMDNTFSTYNPNSLISIINKDTTLLPIRISEHFNFIFNQSMKYYNLSDSIFNPAAKPLFDYWKRTNQENRDSINYFISNSQMSFFSVKNSDNSFFLSKTNKNAQLTFDAIAQGYSVDVIAEFFNAKKIANYFIEIGGEVRAKGINDKNKQWTCGIDEPTQLKTNKPVRIIKLNNNSLATSGNYRKGKILKNNKTVGHIINPKNGNPYISEVISASIIAPSCTQADAMATISILIPKANLIKLLENQKLEYVLLPNEYPNKSIISNVRN